MFARESGVATRRPILAVQHHDPFLLLLYTKYDILNLSRVNATCFRGGSGDRNKLS
jgi:hypothetical protein